MTDATYKTAIAVVAAAAPAASSAWPAGAPLIALVASVLTAVFGLLHTKVGPASNNLPTSSRHPGA